LVSILQRLQSTYLPTIAMNENFPEELISAYLDGQATPEEQQRVEQWLAQNEEHQRLLEDLRNLRCDLQSLPRPTLEINLRDRVLAAIQEQVHGQSQSTGANSSAGFPIQPVAAPARPLAAWQWFSAGIAATLLIGFITLFSLPTKFESTLSQATPRDRELTSNTLKTSEQEFIDADSLELKPEMRANSLAKRMPATASAPALPRTIKKLEPELNAPAEALGAPRGADPLSELDSEKSMTAVAPGAVASNAVTEPNTTLEFAGSPAPQDAFFAAPQGPATDDVLEIYVATTSNTDIRAWFEQQVQSFDVARENRAAGMKALLQNETKLAVEAPAVRALSEIEAAPAKRESTAAKDEKNPVTLEWHASAEEVRQLMQAYRTEQGTSTQYAARFRSVENLESIDKQRLDKHRVDIHSVDDHRVDEHRVEMQSIAEKTSSKPAVAEPVAEVAAGETIIAAQPALPKKKELKSAELENAEKSDEPLLQQELAKALFKQKADQLRGTSESLTRAAKKNQDLARQRDDIQRDGVQLADNERAEILSGKPAASKPAPAAAMGGTAAPITPEPINPQPTSAPVPSPRPQQAASGEAEQNGVLRKGVASSFGIESQIKVRFIFVPADNPAFSPPAATVPAEPR
jgi:hypothetical protein